MIHAFPLARGRVHEACGTAAVSFAVRVAAQSGGDVIWIREGWRTGQLNPLGMDGLDPACVIVAQTRNQIDTLAVAEDALRDGAVSCVVLELTAQIGLTAGRRLQLAAKSGRSTGVCVIPDGMGSNATQTRWRCTPVFDDRDSTLQRWDLIKNKSGTIGSWYVRWHAKTRSVTVVPPIGQRSGPAGAPG